MEEAAAESEWRRIVGRWLFAQRCSFIAGATSPETLPPARYPEIAFAGRSNVGKSTLINALTGRASLARTSHTPGRTQQINFFELADRLMLVDLPGYGYAAASKARVREWGALIEAYLKGRANLRRVMLLIDSRHEPKASDRAIMALLDGAAVAYQAVLTKIDKLAPEARLARAQSLAAELAGHPAAHPTVLSTSAHSLAGIEDLRAELAALAEPSSPNSEQAR